MSSGNGKAAPAEYSGPTTPAVRRLAREHGVDLALVAGTGHGGRVTLADVRKFVDSGGTQQAAAPASGQHAAPAPAVAPSAALAPPPPSPAAQGDVLKQASPMRRSIAAQMTRALQVPVAYTVIEVDMSGAVALREANKSRYQAQEGISLTYDAFVAKAAVEALKRHADFNAHYTDEGHWLRQRINLGIAVAVEDGLVVPVVKDADRLSIHGLNREIRDLADRARAGKLSLDDISGGTFTLDNTGWTGSVITAPIINTPAGGHPDHGDDRQATGGGRDAQRRPDRRPADDVHVPGLRPSRDRRRPGRRFRGRRQEAGSRRSTLRPPSGRRRGAARRWVANCRCSSRPARPKDTATGHTEPPTIAMGGGNFAGAAPDGTMPLRRHPEWIKARCRPARTTTISSRSCAA